MINSTIYSLSSKENISWSWISLIFSLFYFFPIILSFQSYDFQHLIFSSLIYLGFLCLYIAGIYLKTNKVLIPIIAIILLAALGSKINPGTNILFGYAMFLTGFYLSFQKAAIFLLINCAFIFTAAWFYELINLLFLMPALLSSIGLILYGRMLQKDFIFREQRDKDQLEKEQLATIAERERISRDLHDIMGHSLSSVSLKAELASKYLTENDIQQAQNEIDQVAQLCRKLLSEIRQSVSGLRVQGIQHELNRISTNLEKQGYTVKYDMDKIQLDSKMESTLILLLKEASTNILKHCNGNQVTVKLKQLDNFFQFEIIDNGSVQNIQPGNGMKGMQERCEQFSGDFSIDTNQGLHLRFKFPKILRDSND